MAEQSQVDEVLENLEIERRSRADRNRQVDIVVGGFERQEGNISDDEFDAMFVGQKELKNPGARGATRALVDILGDTFEERAAVFTKLFPEGEFVKVPETEDVLFRENKKEDFRKFDAGFFESFGLGFEGFVNEMGRDVADVAGDLPVVAMEALATFLIKRPVFGQGLRRTKELLAVSGGGATGETAVQAAQTVAGTQRETAEEQGQRVAGATLDSLIGGTLGLGLEAGLGIVGQRGLTRISEEAGEAVRAAERIGTSPLLPNQISGAPGIQLLGRQAQAMVATVQNYLVRQEKRTRQAVVNLGNKQARDRFVSEAAAGVNKASDAILGALTTGLKPTSPREAGRALRRGVTAWWEATGKEVDQLYDIARSIEEPIMDVASLRDKMTRNLRITRGTIEGEPFDITQIPADLQNVIGEINAADPESIGIEQLRAWRSRIAEGGLPGPDGARVGDAQYRAVGNAINDTMKNPANANPEFKQAWAAADRSASKRFKTRELAAVVDAANTETPATLARGLVKPGQEDRLRQLMKALPEGERGIFSQFARGELMTDPFKITQKLESFDPGTLGVLMPRKQQLQLRNVGKQFDKLTKTGVLKALDAQDRIRGFFSTVMDTGETARIGEFKKLLRGNPSLTNSTRAAIIDEIVRRSQIREQGVEKLDFLKLSRTLEDFQDRGVLDILTADQVKFLRDAEKVQDFARLGVKDAGTSIQAAEAFAAMRGMQVSGFRTLAENAIMSWFLTTAPGRALLTGTGLKGPLNFRVSALMGAAVAQMAADAEGQKEAGAEMQRLLSTTTRAVEEFIGP